jgi:hypothetical protein
MSRQEIATAMEAALIPIGGYEGASRIVLSPATSITAGRAPTAEIHVNQDKVSRVHCRICFEGGFYSVEDLDSKNGTWVNGYRIEKAFLFHNDRIAIGDARFRFVLDAEITEEASDVDFQNNGDSKFGTEIRDASDTDVKTALLMEMPRHELAVADEELGRDLSIICRVINSVNAEHELDALLAAIMDNVMEVTQADRGYLIAAKKLHGVLMPLVSRNRDLLPRRVRNSFSRSVVTECYEKGYAILKADPVGDYDPSDSVVTQQIQSIMCVPMCDNVGSVGVIYVDRLVGGAQFRERDLKLLAAIGNQAGIAIRRAQLSEQVETLFRDAMRTVINLVEVRDDYTHGHSERVTAVALRIGEILGLMKEDRRTLEIAGLLHDVGKLAVGMDILQKPAKLTDDEYEMIKGHPVMGATVLADVENADAIAEAIRHHHEWWDGTGYPRGLAGEQIPLPGRILAVADAFDSMASERPYKHALPGTEIVEELRRGAGTQFDPIIIETLVDALESDAAFRARVNGIYGRKGMGANGGVPFD